MSEVSSFGKCSLRSAKQTSSMEVVAISRNDAIRQNTPFITSVSIETTPPETAAAYSDAPDLHNDRPIKKRIEKPYGADKRHDYAQLIKAGADRDLAYLISHDREKQHHEESREIVFIK